MRLALDSSPCIGIWPVAATGRPGTHSEGGFHILLEPAARKTSSRLHLWLKCPSCGKEYDFGLSVATAK